MPKKRIDTDKYKLSVSIFGVFLTLVWGFAMVLMIAAAALPALGLHSDWAELACPAIAAVFSLSTAFVFAWALRQGGGGGGVAGGGGV